MPRFVKFAIPYLIFLTHAYSVFGLMEDDSYITLRYAANVAAGHGPVFNAGERVEGFTSFLHLMLDVLLYRIFSPADPLFAVKTMSVFFGVLTLAATYRLARAAGLNSTGAIAAQIALAISISFAVSSVNGLETSLYAFLLTLALTSLLRELDAGRTTSRYLSGFLLFVATLARPDGMVLFGFILAFRWIAGMRGNASMSRDLGKWAAAYLIPLAILFAARDAYFGSIVPNTYFAKVAPISHSIRQGLIYLGGRFPYIHSFDIKRGLIFAVHSAGIGQCLAFGAYAVLLWGTVFAGLCAMRGRPDAGLILTAVVAGQIAFILRSGGDWMSSWRFVAVIFPVLSVAQAWNIPALRQSDAPAAGTASPRRSLKPALAMTACCGFLACALACQLYVRHPSWGSVGYTTVGHRLLENAGWGKICYAIGSYIHEHTPPGASVATSEVGYVAYANLDHPIIDMRGLTDRTIAHLPLKRDNTGVAAENWYVPGNPIYAYFKRRHPDYIITFYKTASTPLHPLGEYDQVDVITAPSFYDQGSVSFWVYRRQGVDRR